jgi:hypothetical protein
MDEARMTEIVPERMTAEERVYAEELLTGSLLEDFRTLLNPELARQIAKSCTAKIAIIQNYTHKQL